jgi:hypothetical protein
MTSADVASSRRALQAVVGRPTDGGTVGAVVTVRCNDRSAVELEKASSDTAACGSPAPRELAELENETERAELRRAAVLACWIWPAFTLLDLYMSFALFPEASLGLLLGMRAVNEALFLFVHRLSRSNGPVARTRRAYFGGLQLCAVFIGLMALGFGGLNSSYMHGLSVAMLVVAIVLPSRWQLAIRMLAPIGLAYPIVMGAAALFSPEVRAAWLDRHALLTFIGQYAFVVAVALVGAVCSHVVWAARQQVYQARKLGRFRLEVPIGEGGMNQVWLAWDAPLQRRVALKILRPAGGQGGQAVQRFEREARAASKLADPHTVRIFDFGASDDGIYYIAMEYLRGADLGALVSGHGPMSPARVVHFGVQACASLAEAHEAGIVHRDIKPQNFFVTRIGDDHDFLKLLDFGLARVDGDGDPRLTRTGVLSGTPAFMASEVCRGEQADARSDIYGLGATMYFLLTGSPPFVGPSAGHVMAAHVREPPERPSTRRGEPIPEALEQVVLRCLAKEPGERFQTAQALASALVLLESEHPWTLEDARRFWEGERAAKLGRWEAPTVDVVEPSSSASAVSQSRSAS